MSTEILSEYSEVEENLTEWQRPEDNLEKQEDASEPDLGVVGLVTEEGKSPLLLHEETLMCWCRPTLVETKNYYVIVHHNKGDTDA